MRAFTIALAAVATLAASAAALPAKADWYGPGWHDGWRYHHHWHGWYPGYIAPPPVVYVRPPVVYAPPPPYYGGYYR